MHIAVNVHITNSRYTPWQELQRVEAEDDAAFDAVIAEALRRGFLQGDADVDRLTDAIAEGGSHPLLSVCLPPLPVPPTNSQHHKVIYFQRATILTILCSVYAGVSSTRGAIEHYSEKLGWPLLSRRYSHVVQSCGTVMWYSHMSHVHADLRAMAWVC